MPDYCDDPDYMDRDVQDGPSRGYCRRCGRPVEERESRGRRTWDEGQIEPDQDKTGPQAPGFIHGDRASQT